jgi:hypothetical protein
MSGSNNHRRPLALLCGSVAELGLVRMCGVLRVWVKGFSEVATPLVLAATGAAPFHKTAGKGASGQAGARHADASILHTRDPRLSTSTRTSPRQGVGVV